MPTIKTNDVEISYRTIGSGPDVVMIHGLAANQAFWLPMAMQLADRFRVTAFDLRGHGYSQTPDSGYTPWHMVEDVSGLMLELGIMDCHLVGHSYGGLVGLGVALRHGHLLRSLTVVDTRVRFLQPHQRLREIPEWNQLAAAIRRAGVPLADDEPELGMCLLEALATPQWRDRFRQLAGKDGFVPFIAGKGGGRSAERWLRLMRTTTARSQLRKSLGISGDSLQSIIMPVLGCYASRSPNVATLRGLAAHLPCVRERIIKDAGHYFPLTHPDVMAREWLQFVDAIGTPHLVEQVAHGPTLHGGQQRTECETSTAFG